MTHLETVVGMEYAEVSNYIIANKPSARYQICLVVEFREDQPPKLKRILGRLGPDIRNLAWNITDPDIFASRPTLPRVLSAFLISHLTTSLIDAQHHAGETGARLRYCFATADFCDMKHESLFINIKKIITNLYNQELDFLKAPSFDKGYGQIKFLCPREQINFLKRGLVAMSFHRDNKTIRLSDECPFSGADVFVCDFDVTCKKLKCRDLGELDAALRSREPEALRDCGALVLSDRPSGFERLCKCALVFGGSPSDAAAVHRLGNGIRSKIQQIIVPGNANDNHPSSDLFQTRIDEFRLWYLRSEANDVAFAGRDRDIEALDHWFDSQKPYLLISGLAGHGKSALAVNWIQRFNDNPQTKLIFYPISIVLGNNDALSVLRYLARELAYAHNAFLPDNALKDNALPDIVMGFLKREPPNKTRILIVIDGLDEILGSHLASGVFPSITATGVKVVVSARSGSSEDDRRWLNGLGWRNENMTQVLCLQPLDNRGIAEILDQLHIKIAPPDQHSAVVFQLERLSEGAPFVLKHFAEELLKRQHGLPSFVKHLADLAHITPGVSGLFDEWLRHHKALKGRAILDPHVHSFMAILACAFSPLLIEDIQGALGQDRITGELIRDAAEVLGRFIAGDGINTGYVYCHPLFRDHIIQRLTHQEKATYNSQLSEYCRKMVQDMIKTGDADKPISRYVVMNYTRHINDDASLPDVLPLIQSNKWYNAWLDVSGSHAGYLSDLSFAWRVIKQANSASVAAQQPIPSVGAEVRCLLITGALADQDSHLSSELLSATYDAGLWTLNTCLHQIHRSNADRLTKFESLLALLQALKPFDNDNKSQIELLISDIIHQENASGTRRNMVQSLCHVFSMRGDHLRACQLITNFSDPLDHLKIFVNSLQCMPTSPSTRSKLNTVIKKARSQRTIDRIKNLAIIASEVTYPKLKASLQAEVLALADTSPELLMTALEFTYHGSAINAMLIQRALTLVASDPIPDYSQTSDQGNSSLKKYYAILPEHLIMKDNYFAIPAYLARRGLWEDAWLAYNFIGHGADAEDALELLILVLAHQGRVDEALKLLDNRMSQRCGQFVLIQLARQATSSCQRAALAEHADILKSSERAMLLAILSIRETEPAKKRQWLEEAWDVSRRLRNPDCYLPVLVAAVKATREDAARKAIHEQTVSFCRRIMNDITAKIHNRLSSSPTTSFVSGGDQEKEKAWYQACSVLIETGSIVIPIASADESASFQTRVNSFLDATRRYSKQNVNWADSQTLKLLSASWIELIYLARRCMQLSGARECLLTLAGLPLLKKYHLVSTLLDAAIEMDRQNALFDLASLMTLLADLGGDVTLKEIALVIEDIAQWWNISEHDTPFSPQHPLFRRVSSGGTTSAGLSRP